MTDPAPDPLQVAETWSWREYPALLAVVRVSERVSVKSWLTGAQIQAEVDISENDLARALDALESDGYFELLYSGGEVLPDVGKIRPEARRAVRQWPAVNTAADRLLEALQYLAENADTEPERTKARTAWQQVGTLSRDTLAAALATVLTGQLPGAGS